MHYVAKALSRVTTVAEMHHMARLLVKLDRVLRITGGRDC